MADDKPIIIIKKKGGHAAHHGGAWKVAYADFVTAMMAFFMVMWLVNTAETAVKQAIASYFRKPGIFESGSGTPLMIGESGILQDGYVPPHPEDTKQKYSGKSKELLKQKSGTDNTYTGDKRVTYRGEKGQRDAVPDQDVTQRGFQTIEEDELEDAKSMGIDSGDKTDKGEKDGEGEAEKKSLEEAAKEITEQIALSAETAGLLGLVDAKVDTDGLNIEIMDTESTSMFKGGSAQILPDAEAAFRKIAPIIAALPNKIEISGHTDSVPFSSRIGAYTNWELSADRANAARRLMEKFGISRTRITSVSGRADTELKVPNDPKAPTNRRITLKVKFNTNPNSIGEQVSAFSGLKPKPTQARELFEEKSEADLPTSLPTSSATKVESSSSTTPVDVKQIVKEELRSKDIVTIPEGRVPTTNPAPSSKDKVFSDSPVIGPQDPFANF